MGINRVGRIQLPKGVKDFLPINAYGKRKIEEQVMQVFSQFGYREVVTPTYEFIETFNLETSVKDQEKQFQFFEREKGRVLTLRSDMTMPIARLVASKMQNDSLPLRLCYSCNLFRYDQPQAGRQREFYQLGVELLGASQVDADAEVIAVAIESLMNVGLKNFTIAIGQTNFINGILEGTDLTVEEEVKVKEALETKNIVLLEELVASFSIPDKQKEILLQIPCLRGKGEILSKAREICYQNKTQEAINNIQEVYEILKLYGLEDYVMIDLGIIRGLDYYTGIIFEGYTSSIGFPICGGGRYDSLLEDFGYPCCATGFAIGIERIILALESQMLSMSLPAVDYYIYFAPEKREEAIVKAIALRREGYSVELEVVEREKSKALNYAKESLFKNLLIIE